MNPSAIAVVGMAGRFPGARNVDEFWRNLRDGVESIRELSDAQLRAAGVSDQDFARPEYVKAAAVLEGVDLFDASFFGFSPRDAAIMDPQHRHFLECAWEALENAGHAPDTFPDSIGVFAGSGMNAYMIHNLLGNRRLVESAGLFLIRQTGNDKDVLATRVSYQLNFRGPSISVQTACSTSLVAVHLAGQSLLNGECDMALAGGVTIEIPHGHGYLYREGEILSRDGHCRAFDAAASGTVFSSGAGIVVLRRLEDAIKDRDTIHAVIRGSAVNNDGARKVGYLAPSVEGQAEVIAEALGVAGVSPEDISYVETHGTGTAVGDPIEIKGLTQAFRRGTNRKGYCAIGSLKTNIGHLDTAAGVAGLIKAALALRHRTLPPSLNFHAPNPLIDFANSPFYVNSRRQEWNANGAPRRAGVTSLGIGGTNVHVVLEEAPEAARREKAAPSQLIVLSAKTESALEAATSRLADHLRDNPALSGADVAFTMQAGRTAFAHRRVVVASDTADAARTLASPDPQRVFTGRASATSPAVVFMFSGQGSQYPGMGAELYKTQRVFREALDDCAERLRPNLGFDLRELLYGGAPDAAERLNRTCVTQPALFSIEYSLARWWMAHGVKPHAMVGHSIGEYVAACLAGVFSLEDGLAITVARGRLMQQASPGAMLAVPLAPQEFSIPDALAIAAANAPQQCVVSGPFAAIEDLERNLSAGGVTCRWLRTSHAFHSAMMDPILDAFRDEMRRIALHAPRVPYASNLTGTWITAEQATDPEYWVRHLRGTVRFADCLAALVHDPGGDSEKLLLEVGPGQTLDSLARQQARGKARVFASLRRADENISDTVFLLKALGKLWISGQSVDWTALHAEEDVSRVPLPAYPFERQRFWIAPDQEPAHVAAPASSRVAAQPAAAAANQEEARPIDEWFYQRAWKRTEPPVLASLDPSGWVVFLDPLGLGAQITAQLRGAGHDVVEVRPGSAYRRASRSEYTLRPGAREDYDALLKELARRKQPPKRIAHLWSLFDDSSALTVANKLDLSFYSLLHLAQALGDLDFAGLDIAAISNRLQAVSGETVSDPLAGALLGPVKVIPKELPGITCRSIDVDLKSQGASQLAVQIIAEHCAPFADSVVAYRNGERWIEGFGSAQLRPGPSAGRLKKNGVYLITGGLGELALAIAERLARNFQARLVLAGRMPLPPAAEWQSALDAPGVPEGVKRRLRKLLEIQALGSEVFAVRVDVTNQEDIARAIALAREKFGPIDGVIHAAGVIEDAPLQIKTRESAARVLEPKVQGTLTLAAALRELPTDAPLDFFALFSSVSSIAPPAGQADYAGANAFLDAYAASRRDLPVVAIHWGPWRDVGMAARAVEHHPLLERRLVEDGGHMLYAGRLSAEKHWVLAEHRLGEGQSLLPGTAYLELAASALTRDSFGRGVEFEDVFFASPFFVEAGKTKQVRVDLRRNGGEGFEFAVLGRDAAWTEYATGQIARAKQAAPAPRRLGEITGRCRRRTLAFDDDHRTKQEQFFRFGPRWRNLKTIQFGENEAIATLELRPEFSSDTSAFRLHPALFDLATGASLYLIENYEQTSSVYLPVSYKKAAIYRCFPAKLYSHIRSHGRNVASQDVASFDITLLDEQGHVLAEIEEFSLRLIRNPENAMTLAPSSSSPSDWAEAAAAYDRRTIAPADGAEALVRILSSELPAEIAVIPGGLEASTGPSAKEAPGRAAPAGDIEAVLASWWQELLGLDRVGLDDDFFELGGQSLVGVRLFAKIKKTYGVNLGLSTLFEARTIGQMAKLVRDASGAPRSEPQSKSPIVAIQPKGAKPPVYVISGLGGNVVKFHSMAFYLGGDQPVYGLLPRGLDGNEPYHTRVEDMAAYYVDAIQAAQPEGPYRLVGYSFGGAVAFEVGQQLLARGGRVTLVGLFDTIEWRYMEDVERSLSYRERFGVSMARLKDEFPEDNRFRLFARLLGARASTAVYRLFDALGRPLPQKVGGLEDINAFAGANYHPKPFPGVVTLFRSTERAPVDGDDPYLGWGGLAASIEVHHVPSTHFDILQEPGVRVLSEKLRVCLDRDVAPETDAKSPALSRA